MSITQVWSCGGGVQSAAIAVLICQGKLRPDIAIMADTGYERSTTWAYMNNVIQPELFKHVKMWVEIAESREWATVGLYSLKEQMLLIPAFTTESGEIGKLPIYCSQEWKKRVTQRYLTKIHGIRQVCFWMGFSIDEAHRAKQTVGKWTRRFPLLELSMTREMCLELVAGMGWPPPPRSSCYMCPNHQQSEWRDIRDNSPDDWRKTIQFEESIQKHDPAVWLHSSGTPLKMADLGDDKEVQFRKCENEACFT